MLERGTDPEDVFFAYFIGLLDAATRGIPPVNSAECGAALGEVAAVGFQSTPFEIDEARSRALRTLTIKFDFQKPDGEV